MTEAELIEIEHRSQKLEVELETLLWRMRRHLGFLGWQEVEGAVEHWRQMIYATRADVDALVGLQRGGRPGRVRTAGGAE